jgi:hypothetical protein
MQDLIASYLVQKKECALPLLGNFKIQSSPAVLDIADKQIIPSSEEIIYSEEADYLSDDLATYVAKIKHIPLSKAEDDINNWCLNTKVKLDSGETITFYSIGNLRKSSSGNVLFQKEKGINFYEPVPAERVIHKDDEHAVLVGDKETTSVAMNEFYREIIQSDDRAWIRWAIGLFLIAFIILIFYFANHSFTEAAAGNQSSFSVQQPSPTYYVPK